LIIDEERLPDVLLAAAASVGRAGAFPYLEGDLPEFSTEDAEALGIKGLISYHDDDICCTTFFTPGGDEKNQNRIHNIHLIADAVNGTIVMPGETFSLNAHVGERTLEKGYRLAGAIIGPDTLRRASLAGRNVDAALARNDAHGFFAALGDQVVTGPTLTNVNDFRAVLILPPVTATGSPGD
jgi:hypothetical protein